MCMVEQLILLFPFAIAISISLSIVPFIEQNFILPLFVSVSPFHPYPVQIKE
eukprot:m.224295 g.224295  ORF g.224295 m.224295 type:complete len:52 (+) comp10828_c8_seq5:4139-4294(+)